ncbi:MAG: GNAT family N-acetyltransferase [Christensenellales bacterium]
MIRKMQKTEIDRVAEIWLEGNVAAHDFIPAQYWERNFEFVKKALAQAEVYVYEEDAAIQGFIGLSGAYIEGIFVCAEKQSQGVGKRLLDFVKRRKDELRLNVYRKNGRPAVYKREGFAVLCEGVDKNSGDRLAMRSNGRKRRGGEGD